MQLFNILNTDLDILYKLFMSDEEHSGYFNKLSFQYWSEEWPMWL
jgi:hypothetical protein